MTISGAEPLTATIVVERPEPLEFGARIERYTVGYRRYGDPALPLVIALGGISAGRHIVAHAENQRRGWWEGFVGDGLAVDTTRYSVLGIDWLGGSGASTGPGKQVGSVANADPAQSASPLLGGHRIDSLFPPIGTGDQADAIIEVLDHLGVAQAHAMVGASYGGMVALSCATHFPERIARAVVISAAHRTHPMATALRSLQRGVVRLGMESGRISEAMKLARGIAMTTYRTVNEFAGRFDAEARWSAEGARFPVEAYLDHSGRRFAESFSAESFLCLSESIDLHWIDPAAVRTPTTLVAVNGDTLVPPWQMQALYDELRVEKRWRVVDSIYGHDAFLKEVEAMSSIVAEALGS